MKINLLGGNTAELDLSKDYIQAHFDDSRNCTKEILRQINDEDFYNEFINHEDEIVVDLGANIGLFSIHVSDYVKKVISVEPTPSHFRILEHLTKPYPNIECLNGAAAEKTAEMDFYCSSTNTTMNSLVNRGEGAIKVQGYTLNDIMFVYELPKIDFLKIDIEGSEVYFLNDKNLATMKEYVNKFFIEFHETNGIGYSEYREKYKPVFEELGFKTRNISVDALYCYK